jgi:hypothetical protein
VHITPALSAVKQKGKREPLFRADWPTILEGFNLSV